MNTKISKNANKNFDNDDIQFARLIAELESVGAFTSEVMWELHDTMELEHAQIAELIERAQAKWDGIKSRT